MGAVRPLRDHDDRVQRDRQRLREYPEPAGPGRFTDADGGARHRGDGAAGGGPVRPVGRRYRGDRGHRHGVRHHPVPPTAGARHPHRPRDQRADRRVQRLSGRVRRPQRLHRHPRRIHGSARRGAGIHRRLGAAGKWHRLALELAVGQRGRHTEGRVLVPARRLGGLVRARADTVRTAPEVHRVERRRRPVARHPHPRPDPLDLRGLGAARRSDRNPHHRAERFGRSRGGGRRRPAVRPRGGLPRRQCLPTRAVQRGRDRARHLLRRGPGRRAGR
jgi:hypothetical protein